MHDSSNLAKVKLVKVLNNLDVVHIVASTSWTFTFESIEWPMFSFNSLALNMSDELTTTIVATKAHYLCLSMSINISYNPLSIEDEKLKLFDLEFLKLSRLELKPWLEDEAMISKWKNPSTWVRTWMRNEKAKKRVKGALTY